MKFILVLVFLSGSVSWGFAQQLPLLRDERDSLIDAGDYKNALLVGQKALMQAETESGRRDTNYVWSLIAIGSIFQMDDQLATADSVLHLAEKLSAEVGGKISLIRSNALNLLGSNYRSWGKYAQAEPLLMEAMAIRKELAGDSTEAYAETVLALGTLYLVSRSLDKAAATLTMSLRLQKKIHTAEHPNYLSSLNNLGVTYLYKEDYAKAEPLLAEVVAIRRKTLGTRHPSYIISLGNLARVYEDLGDYSKAIDTYITLLHIQEKVDYGSSQHAVILNNLAESKRLAGQIEGIDTLYRRALSFFEKRLGHDHIDYASPLNNLGQYYEMRGQYAAAQTVYEEARRIVRNKVGTDNILYSSFTNNLGNVSEEMGKVARADSLYVEALQITEHTTGKISTRYAGYLDNYAINQVQRGHFDKALSLLKEAEGILEHELLANFLYLPPRQKQKFLDRWSHEYWKTLSIITARPDREDVADLVYQSSIYLKSLLLNEHATLTGLLKTAIPLRQLADTLQQLKTNLANQYSKPIRQRTGIDSLEQRADHIEHQMASQSAPFRQTSQQLRTRWQDIRNALRPNEATVEFIHFPYHNGRRLTDSVSYVAVVLRADYTHPRLVPLFEARQLQRLLGQSRLLKPSDSTYAQRSSELDNEHMPPVDSLSQLIWQPIDRLLTGVKRIYVSPSGLLHQLSLAGLTYRTGRKQVKYLGDYYDLRIVSNTRLAIERARKSISELTAVSSTILYGGIQYSIDSIEIASRAQSSVTLVSNTVLPRGLLPNNSWDYLPGSKHEIVRLAQLMANRVTVIQGSEATEESLKKLSGHAPTILHIATHGFFFPNADHQTDNIFRAAADPLLRAGLVMAGANRAWQGLPAVVGADDGILTAYEVANLDLSGTQLVVLSACDTGLGDVQGSEGVFGLQRAFKMAGVRYVLMSLRKIPDEATAVFMEKFYRNWLKKKDIRAGFVQTQRQMRKLYSPSVWAAFVLVE